MPLSVAQISHLTVLIEIGPQEFPSEKTQAYFEDTESYGVKAHYDSSVKRWVCDAGTPDKFLLLSHAVLDALCREAFVKGYPVRYMNSRGQLVRV